MDDDILLEPDSVLRAVAFSRFAREPMLVGGQMLSLQARSQLSTMGEVVDRNTFLWRNAPGTEPHHDLAERTLRQTPWLHRRTDVDYNAWWMCLIPRVGRRGRSGCRCRCSSSGTTPSTACAPAAAGYRTATVPGIAIWHMSFLEKDDTSDWQAYFHYRNRFVAAALHGPDNPRALLIDTFKRTAAAPDADGVLGGGAAGDGAARLPGRPGDAVPEAAGGAGRDPGQARRVRRRPPARLGHRGAAVGPRRAGRPGVPGAADPQGRRSSSSWPAACCTTCAARTRRTTTCRSATCRRGRPSGSCCPSWTRPRCPPRTGAG